MSTFHKGQEVFIIENYDDAGTFSIRRMRIVLLNVQQAVCESVIGADRKIVQAYEFDDVMFAAEGTDPDAKAKQRAAEFIADRLRAYTRTVERSPNGKVVAHAMEQVEFFSKVAEPKAVWI